MNCSCLQCRCLDVPDDPPASDDASVPTYDPQDYEPDWETNIDCWTGVL